jgi:hypothetical protein
MATRRRGSRVEESAWVAEVEAAVVDGGASEEESARWRRHCIYHVPACIKDLNPKAYRPQVVSLGPYHHGEPQLRPLDAHKRRALVHFLRRARRPLAEFAAAVAGGAAEEYERLEGAYEGLGGEWRGAAGEERFVELMVTDGCFLLEVMRAASGWEVNDYAAEDPVFSPHGLLYTVPYIRRDMIMIENQLPLLVLDRLLAVETGKDGVRSSTYARISSWIYLQLLARWNCLNNLVTFDLAEDHPAYSFQARSQMVGNVSPHVLVTT